MSRSETNLYTIKEMNEEERPRERLAKLGPQSLTTAELLAILLRVGMVGETAVQVGQRLLQTFGGLSGIHRASFDELSNQKGVKLAKAAQSRLRLSLAGGWCSNHQRNARSCTAQRMQLKWSNMR